MSDPAARLLDILGRLQDRASWTAGELAARLEVTERTVRNDITRLRDLGYPVEAERGRSGGYRLGGHGRRLPPLLLGDEEAVATAVALRAAMTQPGIAEPAASAAAKLERTLPDRLRPRLRALLDSTDVAQRDTGSNVEDPEVDPGLLARVAAAITACRGLRVGYSQHGVGGRRHLELDPYRLVSWQGRWFVVARIRPSGTWRALRCDWLELREPDASRFEPRPMRRDDYSAFVLRSVASGGWRVHARVLVDAPAEVVRERINPTVGLVERADSDHSVLVTGADSLEIVAVWIGMLGLDFHVAEPPELVEHVSALAGRYRRALPAAAGRPARGRR